MGLLYYVSILVASIVLVLISWLAFSQTFMKIMANIPTGASGGYGSIGARHLLDYAVGHSGTSRALQYYDNNDYNDYKSAASGLLAIGVELVLIYLLFVAILTFVASIFVGALNHFVAEIYTGGTPSVSRSLAYGWEKKWKVYVFQVLLMLAVLAIIVVDVGIPAAAGHAILGCAIAVVMLVIMSTVLLGAVPAIVVENKTPIDAFHRSYNLCKNYFCFIFCNQFMFNVIVLVFSIVNNLALAKAPAVVSFIVYFLINVIMFSIGPILVMVLYMSIRIRSEQLTGQELSDVLLCGGYECLIQPSGSEWLGNDCDDDTKE